MTPASLEHRVEIAAPPAAVWRARHLARAAHHRLPESISQHLDFYWRGTMGVLKRFVEGLSPAA